MSGGSLSIRGYLFFFISISSNEKRVNDSFAPSDLLNNWTAVYQYHSELLCSPLLTFAV